jgi:mannose-6-phosphate isomerase-like protein (cupin superfamily)
VKKIDDMEAVFLGAFKRVRAELGIESFGIQVIDLPPNFDNYPEHDHAHDNQEEVFLVMRGTGEIEIDGERFPLDDNHIARVGPTAKRKVWPADQGVRLVVLGGVPGEPYSPSEVSKLGVPDPMAAS